MNDGIVYQRGFDDASRSEAAMVYDAAFGAKLALAIPGGRKRRAMLEQAFRPRFALAAIAGGRLVGLVGFKTAEGSFTGGLTPATLCRQLGVAGALRAGLVLALFARERARTQLLLDGIAVAPTMRGSGIGSALLAAVKQLAVVEGYTSIRLDVIDTNPKAQRLYTRHGYVPTHTARFGQLRWLLGFGAATTMELRLHAA